MEVWKMSKLLHREDHNNTEKHNNCLSFIQILWKKGHCIKTYGHDGECEYNITARETKFIQSVVMQKISKKKEIKIKGNKEVK